MPSRGQLRRTDRAMSAQETVALLERATVMRIGTVDREGWPYVVPFSFVYHDGKVYFHHTSEESHLSANLKANPHVCIEVDEPGPVFARDESACSIGRVFQSAVAFGRASLVTDPKEKEQVFHRLLARYADPRWGLPPTYPKLETTLVFQVSIEVTTGKELLAP